MTVKEICEKYNLTQTALAKRFDIPLRTVQDWHAGRRNPPDYVVKMIIELLNQECARKAASESSVVQKVIEARRKEVFGTRYIPEGTEVKPEDFRNKLDEE